MDSRSEDAITLVISLLGSNSHKSRRRSCGMRLELYLPAMPTLWRGMLLLSATRACLTSGFDLCGKVKMV